MSATVVSSSSGCKAAATALRNQCHRTISLLASRAPPEAFLYRGNAYAQLGQPYLALADYYTAGRVLRLPSDLIDRCKSEVDGLRQNVTCTYPAVDTHLNLLVKPLLGEGVTCKFVSSVFGRGIVAEKPLPQHHVVMQPTVPWLTYPLVEGLCSFCAKKLPSRIFPCNNSNCHEEYCSRDCRSYALAQYHGRVCLNERFQGVELELFTQMTATTTSSRKNEIAGYLLAMRVLAAAVTNRSVPTALPEVRTLTGRLTFDPRSMSGEMLDLYQKLSTFLGVATSISFEEFIGVVARIRGNSFATKYQLSWDVPKSLFNHSCQPNVEYDKATQCFRAVQPVAPGEELCISYFPPLNHLPPQIRKQELLNRHFSCQCAKCRLEL